MSIPSLNIRSKSHSSENPGPLEPSRRYSSSCYPKQNRPFPTPGNSHLDEPQTLTLNSSTARALTVQRTLQTPNPVRAAKRTYVRITPLLLTRPNRVHPSVREFLNSAPERNNNQFIVTIAILVPCILASLSPLLLLLKN